VSPWLSDRFLASQSDERLVSLARAGHDRAFVIIVERYKRQLHALARRLSPEGRAEDILQQAFLSAFAALRAGVEVDHVRGWLHQIVRNAAFKALARMPNEDELNDDVIGAGGPADEVERRLLVRALFAEVASLPEHQRDALVKTAVQGHSRSEVAVAMGVTEGAVRQLVHRARASLRTAVTAITPYPLAAWAASADPTPGLDRVTEVVIGAGSASVGAAALKAGAVVMATGVVATGMVNSHGRHRPSHPAGVSHSTMVASPGRGAAQDQAGAGGGGGSAPTFVGATTGRTGAVVNAASSTAAPAAPLLGARSAPSAPGNGHTGSGGRRSGQTGGDDHGGGGGGDDRSHGHSGPVQTGARGQGTSGPQGGPQGAGNAATSGGDHSPSGGDSSGGDSSGGDHGKGGSGGTPATPAVALPPSTPIPPTTTTTDDHPSPPHGD
jgi:RNA polymerase sigma factor (sigma-70 family)